MLPYQTFMQAIMVQPVNWQIPIPLRRCGSLAGSSERPLEGLRFLQWNISRCEEAERNHLDWSPLQRGPAACDRQIAKMDQIGMLTPIVKAAMELQ